MDVSRTESSGFVRKSSYLAETTEGGGANISLVEGSAQCCSYELFCVLKASRVL